MTAEHDPTMSVPANAAMVWSDGRHYFVALRNKLGEPVLIQKFTFSEGGLAKIMAMTSPPTMKYDFEGAQLLTPLVKPKTAMDNSIEGALARFNKLHGRR